jgi:site-specific DNA-methyltransferase (adenine-specific)
MSYEQIGNATIYLGDYKNILSEQQDKITAVITDPPYGIKNNCDYTRFRGGLSQSRNYHKGIHGDDQAFDPSPLLDFSKVVLFGANFYADKLPIGTWFVWNKRRPSQLGKFLSDCELIWCKGGKGVYLFNHVWNGFDRETEKGNKSLHPTQKPVALFHWIIDRLKLTEKDTIFDPFMGSGPCGVTCLEKGIKYIGCEIEPNYYEIAKERLSNVKQESKTTNDEQNINIINGSCI